jgi:hypothetical protein
MEKGAMTFDADTNAEQMHSVSFRWPVHFLFGQRATWGEPKSQWKWIGKGELAIDRDTLHLAGQRHGYFRFAAKQAVEVRPQQVRNVVAADRLVKFDVKLDSLAGERVETVRLRTISAQAAQDIASALPKTRTQEFKRVKHEKLAYDRSMEQLGSRSIATSVLVAANIAWFAIVASQGGGWLLPRPGIIIRWGSNFGRGGAHAVEQFSLLALQHFSVRYPTRPFMTLKSALYIGCRLDLCRISYRICKGIVRTHYQAAQRRAEPSPQMGAFPNTGWRRTRIEIGTGRYQIGIVA